MTDIKFLKWYFILSKRLLKKVGFIVILLSIPILTTILALHSSDEGGLIRVAVTAEAKSDFTDAVIVRLSENTRVLSVTECETEDEAIALVKSAKADTAWVLNHDIEEKIQRVALGKRATLVTVYASEDDSFVRSSREKLFGSIFPEIAYSAYIQYINSNISAAVDIPKEELRSVFDTIISDDGIVDFTFLDSTKSPTGNQSISLAPLRGILVTLILFCSLAAAMYFISDEKRNVFSCLPPQKRIFVFFGNNLAATSLSAVFVTAALILSGTYSDFATETLMMSTFVLAAAVFSTLIGTVCKTERLMAAALPIVLVATLAFCPVFFNTRMFIPLQAILPPYYYLYGINDPFCAVRLILYSAILFPFAYFIYVTLAKRKNS